MSQLNPRLRLANLSGQESEKPKTYKDYIAEQKEKKKNLVDCFYCGRYITREALKNSVCVYCGKSVKIKQ